MGIFDNPGWLRYALTDRNGAPIDATNPLPVLFGGTVFGSVSDPPWDGTNTASIVALLKAIKLQGDSLVPVHVIVDNGSVATASVPINTTLPAISGTSQVGQTLTVSTGAWSNSPTSYTYQWKRGGVAISGATGTTYTVVLADLGTVPTCTVVASNSIGASQGATSAPAATVVDIAPGQVTGVTITGQTAASVSLSWTAPSTGGATTDYLLLYRTSGSGAFTTIDQGSALLTGTVSGLTQLTAYDFAVQAKNSGGTGAQSSVVTGSTASGTPVPVNSAAPAITGTAQVGSTLTLSNGTWSNSPTGYAYQFKSGTTNVGTNQTTYVVQASDIGKTITGSVVASNAGGASTAATSAPTATVTDQQPGPPSNLTSTAQTATTLSFSWSAPTTGGTPVSYSFAYRVTGSGGTLTYVSTGSAATSGTLTGLQPSTSYDVLVFATNTYPFAGPTSNTVTVSTSASSASGSMDFSNSNNSGLIAAIAA